LHITVQIPDQEKEKASIQIQGNLSKAEAFYSKTKKHKALQSIGESDELLAELAGTGDKLFNVWFAVLAKDESRDAAERRAREILRAFPRLGGARAIEDHMNHDRIFLSFLPLQGDDNPLYHRLKTDSLIHLLPLQASWKGSQNFGILLKTYRDEPLKLDLFDPKLPAKHAVMLGSTGSGKSFFTTHLLLYFLIESHTHEVIVIDVGGSYRKLAQVLGGSYLEVECSERYALNPFPRKESLFPEGKEADATFLAFLKELLQKMIAPRRLWSSSELMLLERAVGQAYASLRKEDSPLLGDIERVLRNFSVGDEEDRQKARQFAKELSLFTEGEYGKVLNRRGDFHFDSRFIVFDLRKISHYPELQELLLLIIPFALKRKLEAIEIKKILVLDECWRLLKETQGTELVEVFYRTARKMNAGVLSITQNPEDFLEAKIASSIINNSPIRYILRLKKGQEKLGLFGLNENEVAAVGELEVRPGFYSEAFIKFDERSVIVKLEPSPLDYWIATTDAVDLAEEARIRRDQTLGDLEILERLAREFPHGAGKAGEVQHA
jgi:conjugal transfer ATP-binding protein TraC